MLDKDGVEKLLAALRKPEIVPAPISVPTGERAALHVMLPPSWTLAAVDEILPRPLCKPLTFQTLGALSDYLQANRDKLALDAHVAHVVSPTRVELLGPLVGHGRQREIVARAECPDLAEGFLGQYKDQASMVIGLLTRFQDGADRAALLQLVGTIKGEAVQTSKDDGISQSVEVRQGVALAALAAVPTVVELTPYRTFREVDQPQGRFILRLNGVANRLPEIGLFEADGGAWKLGAVARIAAWLTSVGKLGPLGVNVLA